MSNLTERALRKQLNQIIRGPLVKKEIFIAENSLSTTKKWLRSLQLSSTEKETAAVLGAAILLAYESRLKALRTRLKEMLT